MIDEIKQKFEIPGPSSHLSLYKSDGTTEIDVEDSPSLKVDGNSSKNPLIVKVIVDMSYSSSETNLDRNIMHPNRLKRQKALNNTLDKSRHSNKRKVATEDNDVSTPYSKTTWGIVKEIFEVEMKVYYEPVIPIPEKLSRCCQST